MKIAYILMTLAVVSALFVVGCTNQTQPAQNVPGTSSDLTAQEQTEAVNSIDGQVVDPEKGAEVGQMI